jgi:hypothetical protein
MHQTHAVDCSRCHDLLNQVMIAASNHRKAKERLVAADPKDIRNIETLRVEADRSLSVAQDIWNVYCSHVGLTRHASDSV